MIKGKIGHFMCLRSQYLFKIVMFLLACGMFGGLKYPCHKFTEGFSLFKITHPLESEGPFSPPELSVVEKELLLQTLSQPFHYLSHGGQVYVFMSEDEQYVLKFVKFQRLRVAPWIQKLPLPKILLTKQLMKAQKRARILKKMYQSYDNAYRAFKEETAILYHHLQLTKDLKKSVVLFDKLGYRYDIDLDQYAFVVQKKGIPTDKLIKLLIQEGKIEEACLKLDQLIEFVVAAAKKGIDDQDIKFKANLGFRDNRVIQLDMGSLRINHQQQDRAIYLPKIHQAGLKFCGWLEKNAPQLVGHFVQSLEQLQKDSADLDQA